MTRIRTHLAVALLAAGAMIATPAQAVELGVVNVKELLEKSSAIESLKKQSQTASDKIQKDIQDKDKKLAAEGKEIEKQRTVLDKAAYEKKAVEFQGKVEELKKDFQERMAKLKDAHMKAMGEVQKKILDISKELAEEKKLDVIAQMDMLPYADPKLNVTEDLAKRLNKAMPDVSLDLKK